MTPTSKPQGPMTYDRLLGMQLTTGAFVMTMIGRQLRTSRPNDPEWVALANKLLSRSSWLVIDRRRLSVSSWSGVLARYISNNWSR